MKLNSDKAMLACEWIVRLVKLNLLWIAFTIFGLIVFGFMPATVAMFAVARKWIQGQTVKTAAFFWKSFKDNFIKSNFLGSVLLLISVILFFDYRFLQAGQHPLMNVMALIILFMSFFYFVMLLFIFPIFAHYDLRVIDYMKNSLLIGILYPKQTFPMIIALIFLSYISISYLIMIPFFSMSILALSLTWFSNQAFLKVEQNKKKVLESEVYGIDEYKK